MRGRPLTAAGELGKQGEFAGDERLLLDARPAFQLPLGREGLGHAFEPLRIDQDHRTTGLCVTVDDARVVLADAPLQGSAGRADVVVTFLNP